MRKFIVPVLSLLLLGYTTSSTWYSAKFPNIKYTLTIPTINIRTFCMISKTCRMDTKEIDCIRMKPEHLFGGKANKYYWLKSPEVDVEQRGHKLIVTADNDRRKVIIRAEER